MRGYESTKQAFLGESFRLYRRSAEKCHHDRSNMKNRALVEADNIIQVCEYAVQPVYDLDDDFHRPRGRRVGALGRTPNFEQLTRRVNGGREYSQ